MRTREALAAHMASGAQVDFLFFYGHKPRREGRADPSCFSQWFPRAFVADDVHYATAEHFMMAEKARLFKDEAALEKILEVFSPADAKALGREVKNFDEAVWNEARFDAVVRGNLAKFGAHPDLKAFLLSTGERVLVEASPRDKVWGIGMGAQNPDARTPAKWRGKNLLGFALMEARARFAPAE
jgi:ribA/ribD-fused uncharacterized protein